MKIIKASEFKTHCLALLDEVSDKGTCIEIMKRGKPVARLVPTASSRSRYQQDDLKVSVQILGDIIEPVIPHDVWEALSR